jgi:copper chaperone
MEIQVDNIKCGGCSNSIKIALLKLLGVKSVSINKETETILIEGNPERELVIHELSKLGYPEKGKNTFLHQAKSMVSCVVGKLSEEHA